MKEIKEMNIGELAAYICDYLFRNGIECVLSGGACVSIYSDNKYLSMDLDFIEKNSPSRKAIKGILEKIGFIEENRYFKNPETNFFIEFPSGPLSVGSEPVKEIHIMNFPTGKLRILSPTDCIKDRLAAYYFWDDELSLEQAIMVSKSNNIDLNEIERWSKAEGQLDKFNQIKSNFIK